MKTYEISWRIRKSLLKDYGWDYTSGQGYPEYICNSVGYYVQDLQRMSDVEFLCTLEDNLSGREVNK